MKVQSFKCFETTKRGCLVYLYCNRSDILFCSLHLVAMSEFVVASSATRYTSKICHVYKINFPMPLEETELVLAIYLFLSGS